MLCGNVKTDMIEHMMFAKRTWCGLSPMHGLPRMEALSSMTALPVRSPCAGRDAADNGVPQRVIGAAKRLLPLCFGMLRHALLLSPAMR